jgi:hypothetical protein
MLRIAAGEITVQAGMAQAFSPGKIGNGNGLPNNPGEWPVGEYSIESQSHFEEGYAKAYGTIISEPESISSNFIQYDCGFKLSDVNSLNVTETHVDPTCTDDSDGRIDITVSGGKAPYLFYWSNGSNLEDLSGLAVGKYNVLVIDASGSTSELEVVIGKETIHLELYLTVLDAACNGAANGSINLEVAGGNSPYRFTWSNGETTEDITDLGASLYTVSVYDGMGCHATGAALIAEPDPIFINIKKNHVTCSGMEDIAASLSISGGTGPYSYKWSSGATTRDVSEIAPGTYTVTVTDAYGCTSVATAVLTGPKRMQARIKGIVHASDNACDGSIDIGIAGGTPPFTYKWTTGATTQDVSGLCPGSYRVKVTDALGCVMRRTFQIYYKKDLNPVRLDASSAVPSSLEIMKVYPSPADNMTTMQLLVAEDGLADVAVYNMIGKEVMNHTRIPVSADVTNEIEIDVGHLDNGLYFINVVMNGKVVTAKIQVSH